MARSLQPREPSGSYNFEHLLLDSLPSRYPDLVERLKAHRVSRQDSDLLTRLIEESTQMKLSILVHLAKYAPEGSSPRKYADRHLSNFVETCFVAQHPKRDQLMDDMLAFFYDNPKVHKHYFNLVRSWEVTDSTLAHIFRHGQDQGGGAGDSGKSGGGDKGSAGNGGRSEPEGGPPGFDPL